MTAIVQTGAHVSECGYAHYSGEPVTPGCHEILLVPQSIVDGWQAFCSCGRWRAFASFYEHATKQSLLEELKTVFDAHKIADFKK